MRHRTIAHALRVASIAGATAVVAASAQAGVTVTPTWDATITGDANAAKIEAAINAAIAQVTSSYTDNVDVKIKFQEGGGLGGSSTWLVADSYAGFKAALTADAKDALDSSAVASLPGTDPFTNQSGDRGVIMTTAGARALGYSTGATPDGLDCTITLNTSICFFRDNVVSNQYDLEAVAMHEIDEAMGGGGPSSMIGDEIYGSFFANNVGTTDLFRYSASGVRSTLADNPGANYLSFDGGVTKVRDFNNGYFGGDYADWASDGNAFVQNAYGTPGVVIDYSDKEREMMDGIGWDRTQTRAVPEPATIAICGMGLAAMLRRRRKA